MKTRFIAQIIFITSIVNPGITQELKITNKSNGQKVRNETSKSDRSNDDNSKHNLNSSDSLSENYQMLLEEYFQLPDIQDRNFVRSSDGKTYTGTQNGIKMCDGSSTIIITTENSNIPENNITALALDKDEHLWIGTFSSGIVIGVGGCIKPYKIKPIKTRGLNIYSISTDKKGHVWVNYQNGEFECFQDGKSIAYFPKE